MDRLLRDGTVVIADTQFLITEAMRLMLESNGITAAAVSSRKGLQELLEKERVRLVITDHGQLWPEGIPALAALQHAWPSIPILMLAGSIDGSEIRALSEAGIRNVAMKTDDCREILQAVNSTLAGEPFYSREVLDLLLQEEGHSAETLLLSPEEIAIVRLLAAGCSIDDIAGRKGLSTNAVGTYRKNIYRKLRVGGRRELISFAVRAGLIDDIEYRI